MDNKTIMLVEDNPDDITLTLRALTKNNIMNKVVLTRDGAEALEYLQGLALSDGRGGNALPVVILLDLNLPRIGGLELLAHLRADEFTRMIPVVILTSSREEQDLIRSYRLGANSYIRKPVDFNQFIEAIGLLGIYWLVLNQAPPRPERRADA
jgi:two-component system, response regulator